MSSKDAILCAIRAAAVPHAIAVRSEVVALEADIEAFCERVRDYKANVYEVTEPEIYDLILWLVTHKTVIVDKALNPDWYGGIECRKDDETISHAELAKIDCAITTSAVGVAETGTIVLDHTGAQGRRVISLLPDHHICVIYRDQVVALVDEAVAKLKPGRLLTWISGPSATSDIELVRVEGVHGPRRLDVVVVSR